MLQPIDYLKALATAVVIVMVNVAISYGVMAVYSHMIDPGHELAYYEAAAQRIAPWSSIVFGPILFFFASYFFAKRRPERSAVGFALAIFAAYALIEVIVMTSAGKLIEMFAIVALSMTTKLVGGLLGAKRAQAHQTG